MKLLQRVDRGGLVFRLSELVVRVDETRDALHRNRDDRVTDRRLRRRLPLPEQVDRLSSAAPLLDQREVPGHDAERGRPVPPLDLGEDFVAWPDREDRPVDRPALGQRRRGLATECALSQAEHLMIGEVLTRGRDDDAFAPVFLDACEQPFQPFKDDLIASEVLVEVEDRPVRSSVEHALQRMCSTGTTCAAAPPAHFQSSFRGAV